MKSLSLFSLRNENQTHQPAFSVHVCVCVCASDQLLLLALPKSHVRRIPIGIPAVCERQINAHVLLSRERVTVLVLGREQCLRVAFLQWSASNEKVYGWFKWKLQVSDRIIIKENTKFM